MSQTKSFHFTPTGARDEGPPPPPHFGLARLAEMYKELEGGELEGGNHLSSALVHMTKIGDPRLMQNPESVVLNAVYDDPDRPCAMTGVEVAKPYSWWENGDRCVLVDPEAHLESFRRRDKQRAESAEVLSEPELLQYAATGKIPPGLGAASLGPAPLRVVLDLSAEESCSEWTNTISNLLRAHRDFKIELCAVLLDNAKDAGKFKVPWVRGELQIRKTDVNDDPHKARGFLEIALRRRLLVQENLYPLDKMPYKFINDAYRANRKDILKFKGRRDDNRVSWATKKKWAREYQIEKGGIGSTKINYEKRRKKVTAPPSARGPIHLASDGGLQMPQIVWQTPSTIAKHGEWNPTPCDVWLMSGKAYIKAFAEENEVRADKNIILAKSCPVDPHSLDDGVLKQVRDEKEIDNVHLLLQFLPLWWYLPTLPYVSSASMPNLEARLQRFFAALPPEDEDLAALQLTDGVKALFKGGPYLAAFAAACGWSDCAPVQCSI